MVRRVVEPDWSYAELQSDPAAPDLVSWKLIITTLLQRFGGIHGHAIPVDVVAIRPEGSATIRFYGDRLEYVCAAMSGEVDGRTVRVLRSASFLPSLI